MTVDALRERYEAAGQGHLFKFWPKLSEVDQQSLAAQLELLDIERVNRIYKKAVGSELELLDNRDPIEPLPRDASDSVINNPEKESEWRHVGLEAIARGQIGVLLMAGGQGTRLGSSAPKGCYDIGLNSHKSLFQYQAERIARLQIVAQEECGQGNDPIVIPWYVMTSGPTRRETEAFFIKHSYFGLDQKNVIFFEQGTRALVCTHKLNPISLIGTLPCLTMEGRVLLDSPSHVAVAPDGNGGLYAATRAPLSSSDKSHTVLSDLATRKVLYVHAYCVDNCLVRVADPVFLGYCISKQADCAAKVVPKSSPTESVGVVAVRGNKYSVVEYSEISKEQAEKRDPETSELAFRAGNIANHFYTTGYLNEVESFEEELAFHIARKKIPCTDLETGEAIKPSKPNGMKLEMFVFDVFPYTKRFAVLEVARNNEFSPLKNAPGSDSDNPETSRRDLLAQHRRFLEGAGATLNEGVEIEVSPLISYAGEGLQSVKGKVFTRSGFVEKLEEFDALL
jgi:UDP-N-acetylglucosamine/UDP-N-acetylgalactosamine diphosphorylase